MSSSPDSRPVLVTGASRGIGAAIAQAFAAQGDRVAVHYSSSAAQAQQVLESLPGSGHVRVHADLANPEAVRAMVDSAAEQLGGLQVLINNAGIFEAHPIEATDYETWQDSWQRTISVNLLGAANACWCAVPYMRAAGGGAIVNVSSRGAFRGEPGQPAYGASKAGMIAMGQSLALALGGDGISVTAIAPGFVATDMARASLAGEAGDVRRAESPFGRVSEPEEVAAAAIYLASPQARMASGSVIDINGASFLRM